MGSFWGGKCKRCQKKALILSPHYDFCHECQSVFDKAVKQLAEQFIEFPLDIVDGETVHKFTPMVHLAGLLNDEYDLEKPERAELMRRKIKKNITLHSGFGRWYESWKRELDIMERSADSAVRTIWTNRLQRKFIEKHLKDIMNYEKKQNGGQADTASAAILS